MIVKHYLFYLISWLFLIFLPIQSNAAPSYHLEATGPSEVELSGVLHPSNNGLVNGTFKTTVFIFNEDQSVPTASFNQDIKVVNNYFRTSADLKSLLIPFLRSRKRVTLKIQFTDDLFSELPIASIPTVIKSSSALNTIQMMDDDVIFYDYENQRIGIGTQNPAVEVDVVGTVNVSGYLYGDGSQLTNLSYKGADNYNFLRSEDGDFLVVTVNIDGDVMLGGRTQTDSFLTDLTVYGSLLVESSKTVTSDIVSGAGSRWMWYSERDVLRIGYVPSYYWDDQYSGNNSIVFGYASLATGNYSVVTGGYYNEVRADSSIIAGGSENKVLKQSSIIVGGQNNLIDSKSAIILGGKQNQAKFKSIVLGGYENESFGDNAVVSGFKNKTSGSKSIVLGGKHNRLFANQSIAIGKNTYLYPTHNNTIVFGLKASDSEIQSISSGNIFINVDNGVGIGTSSTTPNAVMVNGIVSANYLIGDASKITNVKNPNSAWGILLPSKPTFLVHEGRMGVGTSNLIESLNVEGSIHISGEAEEDEGTIRYFNDEFSVYKNGEWVSLQMLDTDTTYSASRGLSLNTDTLTFDLVTENAAIGQVLIWNGNMWKPAFLDQFIEQAEPSRVNDLATSKRLFFPDGNVVINKPDSTAVAILPDYPLTVYNSDDQDTSMYLFDNTENSKSLSLSISPPGVHFQAYYNLGSFIQSADRGAGFEVSNNTFVMYIDDDTGVKTPMVEIDSSAIRINDSPTHRNYPFYVGGSMATDAFLFDSSLTAVGLYLLDDYYRNCNPADFPDKTCFGSQAKDRSVVFEQTTDGEVTFQSGPYGGDIVFSQLGQQIARVKLNKMGNTVFGLTPKWPRSEVDIYEGDIHITDGYGIGFYQSKTKFSDFVFDSTKNNRIEIFTSSELNVPNFSVSETGNVAINAPANNDYDLYVTSTENARDITVQLNALDDYDSAVRFLVDENDDADFDESGEQYQMHLNNSQLVFSEGDDKDPFLTIAQEGYVGFNDQTPTSALSVSGDIVMLNQTGLYFNEVGNSSLYPALEVDSNSTQIESSDHISLLNPVGNVSIDIDSNGVAINTYKERNTIQAVDIEFEVSGNMVVSGNIYNTLDDKIFPLDVKNQDLSKEVRTIDTINFDTESGITLTGTNTPNDLLKVVGRPYYNRIKLPNGDIFSADGNTELRLIGRGITVTANNQNERAKVTDLTYDNLKLFNDLISGGQISGNLTVKGDFIVNNGIGGRANILKKVPYRWQQVTRNNTAIPDLPGAIFNYYDEGEIYYTKGKVGINTNFPNTLFEVAGTASIKELLNSNGFQASIISSTSNLNIDSDNQMSFQSKAGDIIIGRNGESVTDSTFDQFLKVTPKSQLLFDNTSSQYLIDVGKNNYNYTTEFLIDSDIAINIDLKRDSSQSFLSLRYDRDGSVFPKDLVESHVEIESSNGLAFFTNNSKNTLQLLNNGNVGIFEPTPVNSLDIAGNLSIGITDAGPANSLIVQNNVGVGFGSMALPRSALEVSGSVIVGEPSSVEIPKGFYIKGTGSSKMLIGGLPKSNERLFANGDMSIKNGRLTVRNGIIDALVIERDNTSSKVDTISQLESLKGINFFSLDAINFKTFDGVSNWNNELVLTTTATLGIGGVPDTVFHVMDDDNDTIVKINSAADSMIRFKYGSYQAVIGTNADGFKIKTDSSSLSSAELTIDNDNVGINANPKGGYDVHVNGNLNALNYVIQDQFTATGYRDFQSVPSGVIVLWIGTENNIPPGWQKCNGSNGCPNMDGKFVKGVNTSYSNINDTGGSHDGVLSESLHTHSSASHKHKLTKDGHSHSFSVNNHSIGNTRWNRLKISITSRCKLILNNII